MWNTQFILSVSALLLGVLLSLYLLTRWLLHSPRPRYLLFWAVALFLMFWFQVPIIMNSLGRTVTVTSFNFFFTITLPITFLALICIYLGLRDILAVKLNRFNKVVFYLWFGIAVIFFSYYFIANEGVIRTYSMPLVGNLVFYTPLRLLIITTLVKWLAGRSPKTVSGVLGALAVIGESVIGLIRNFLVVKTVLAYPPAFWYVAMNSLKIFFILQTVSVVLLAVGFFFLHRMHCRTQDGNKKDF